MARRARLADPTVLFTPVMLARAVALGLTGEDLRAAINREPFRTTWLVGYYSAGGSYLLASPGSTTDSGLPRDLIIVLPAALDRGRIIPVNLLVNPSLVRLLQEASG